MADIDQKLDDIVTRAIDNYPTTGEPNEIEFALAGYTDDKIFDKKWNMGISRFGNILKSVIKDRAMSNPTPKVMITVSCNKDVVTLPPDTGNARARINDNGTGQIARQFCISNKTKSDYTTFELKRKLRPSQLNKGATAYDMPEFGLRLRYAEESPLPDDNVTELENAIVGKKETKWYRYAQRYSIPYAVLTSGTKVQIDFSSVKEGTGRCFSGAQIVGISANKVKDLYEVEVELSNDTGPVTVKDIEEARDPLKEILGFLIRHMQGNLSQVIHDNNEVTSNLRNYMDLCQGFWTKSLPTIQYNFINQTMLATAAKYFIAPAIATINRNILKNKVLIGTESQTKYYFTDKADGLRCLLYINNKGHISLISKSGLLLGKRGQAMDRMLNIWPTGLTIEGHEDTVLDGELIEVDSAYYYLTFDIVIHKGTLVNTPSFADRYSIFKKIKAQTKHFSVIPKKFTDYTPAGFCSYISNSNFERILDNHQAITGIKYTHEGITYNLDGIVFQPAMESYQALSVTWASVYKYKPMSLLTVDLRLGYDRKLEKSDGNTLNISKIEHPDTYAIYQAAYNTSGELSNSPHPCYARVVNGFARTLDNEPINRGDIVECRMITSTAKPYWEPLKVRYDKHKPNSIMVHQDVLDQLYEPISLKNFCDEDGGFGGSLQVTGHNRWLSNRYISKYALKISKVNINLIDLACGNIKSGSAWIAIQKRLNENRPKRVLKITGIDSCIDNATNIAICYTYMSNVNLGRGKDSRTLFNQGTYNFYEHSMILPIHRSEGNPALREQLVLPESSNIITCIFAIYYTFASESNFRAFLANVSRNLKPGGFFICSYMNGKHVRKGIAAESGTEIVGRNDKKKKIWSIKIDTDNYAESPFGNRVSLGFSNLYSNDHTEYLVDLTDERITDIMREYGLELAHDEQFSSKNDKLNLSKDEQQWALLHHNTCFKKVKMDIRSYDAMFENPNVQTQTQSQGLKSKSEPVVKPIVKPMAKTKSIVPGNSVIVKPAKITIRKKLKPKAITKPKAKAKATLQSEEQ